MACETLPSALHRETNARIVVLREEATPLCESEHSHYPDDIWAYLNSVPPGAASQASRKGAVVRRTCGGRPFRSPDSPRWKRRIAPPTSTNAADKDLNIEPMNERAALLADVENQVLLMDHDLADLLRGLRPK